MSASRMRDNVERWMIHEGSSFEEIVEDAGTAAWELQEEEKIPFADAVQKAVDDQRDTFQFPRRSRRPPLDPFNTLLSLLYTLLVSDCRSATCRPQKREVSVFSDRSPRV